MGSTDGDLGRELRERRRAAGLTRTRLADRAGIDAADLGRWERGDGAPDAAQTSAVAAAIGVGDETLHRWLGDAATGPEPGVETAPAPPAEPPPLRVAPEATPRRPAPAERSGLVGRPRGNRLTAVFPEMRHAGYDPAVRIYSTEPATFPSAGDESFYRLRVIRTTAVLIALAIVLWWALGSLGEGWSDLLDLFRDPAEVPLLDGA